MPGRQLDRRAFLHRAGGGAAVLAGSTWLGGLLASCGNDGGGGGGAGGGDATPRPLNFVYILIDDLGWTDLACYGSGYYETPNTDALAASGMKFTNAYAACCVCSPTRASIMTGKYPARLHLTDWIAGHTTSNRKLSRPPFAQELPLSEVTIAEALKAEGYATAHFGKWHLGGSAYWPDQQGFDLNFGGTGQGQPPAYFDPYGISTIPDGPDGEYLTDRLGTEVANWIEAHAADKFFVYLSHYAVHTPIQAKQALIDKYTAKPTVGGHTNATYAAMIESVDDTVGQVMTKLNDLGIADRTVIVFMSDNGGLGSVTSNAPLRAGKGTVYEGGVREPMIIKWPGVVAPGSTCEVPVTSVDFFPTICEMAGIDPGAMVDGESLVSLLRGIGAPARQSIFWHYPHYHTRGAVPYGAVRRGDYKLIWFYEDGHLELYNLAEDIGESNNLAAANHALALELRNELAAWLRDTDAHMPLPNAAWSTGTWSRVDCDLWADYHRQGLVSEADVRKVVKLYREQ